MKLLSATAITLFAGCVLHAAPIYLLGGLDDDSDSFVNSINASNLVVGSCAQHGGDDVEPCYWDLNEQPVFFTSTNPGMVSAYVLRPHLLPSPPCTAAGSEISDIDNSGRILGRPFSLDPPFCTDYVTGQVPNFTGWTPLPDRSEWTHVPTLANSNWVLTNDGNPFGSSRFMAHANAVPEPSTFGLLGAVLGAIHVYRRRRARG